MKDLRLQAMETPDSTALEHLTKEQLAELEEREKTLGQKAWDVFLSVLPILCCCAAVSEYILIPDKYANSHPERYLCLLLIPAAIYAAVWLIAIVRYRRGDKPLFGQIRYRAPFYSAVFLALAVFDYLTLKTGYLLYPFIPWVNDILNAAIADWSNLMISTVFTLRLLLLGYFSGVAVGLVTGIVCGYSTRVRYWVNPIIKVLGPIPPVTWIPLIMIVSSSLFGGAVFIIALSTWFSVTVAAMTGVTNVDRAYFDAARTLGATERQIIWNVAIPHAMPSILQGMTQGMSSACVVLLIAEMLGVEAGLGWYITWAKAWAMFNRMFAAIVVICIIFNVVTKGLDMIKKRVLRWQTGMVK